MMLSITIPAYNEEEAIESILTRCLEARERIVAETDVDEVEIIVVSDGSNDRTVERATPFVESGPIKLIAYTPNRGYGAALKLGFKESKGELVSFLDADGTCAASDFDCDGLVGPSDFSFFSAAWGQDIDDPTIIIPRCQTDCPAFDYGEEPDEEP